MRQQVCDYGIHYTAVVGNRLIELGLRGNASRNGKSDAFALSFIGYEPESPVFDQGTAQRTAKLVVVKSILGCASRIEKIPSVQGIVAEVFVRAAVQTVGAGFGDEINSRSRVASEFCFRIAYD